MGSNVDKMPVREAQTETAESLLPLVARSLLLVQEAGQKLTFFVDALPLRLPLDIALLVDELFFQSAILG